MSDNKKQIVFNPVGWFFGLIIGALVVSYAYSFKMPIKVIKEGSNAETAFAGEPYTLCRDIVYSNDTHLILDRSLIRHLPGGVEFTISLASISVTREAGAYSVCRIVPFPPRAYMEPGEWTIRTSVTWKYFIWTQTRSINDVTVTVLPDEFNSLNNSPHPPIN